MVGQEHVLQALINALDHDRLHHAYLFTGTRGVGKTTIARILAKCLNCEVGVSSEPCDQCDSCLEIAEGRFVDLIEVDAASRTKVEDTRDLLDNVQYAPTRARYKVYLIDEVHMLSSHSFNALLKTLEEPPPHVKFLFATTDPQKLPATILSRCLQFNLKNMIPERIVAHLAHVLEQEKVSFEEPGLWLLARAADGSMRDALSLTDQAIAFGSGKISEDDVRSMLGTIDQGLVYSILESVASQNGQAVLDAVEQLSQHAPDYEAALSELLALLHRVAIAQAVPNAIDESFGDSERVAALAETLTAEDVQLYYQTALVGKRDIGLAADPLSGMEMTLLRMLVFRPQGVLETGDRVEEVAASLQSSPPPEGGAEAKKPPEALSGGVPQKQQETPSPSGQHYSHSEQLSGSSAGLAESDRNSGAKNEIADIASADSALADIDATLTEDSPPPVEIESEVTEPEVCEPASTELEHAGINDEAISRDAAEPALVLENLRPEDWPRLLDQTRLNGIVYEVASHCVLDSIRAGVFNFVLDEHNASLYNESQKKRIGVALSEYFKCPIELEIIVGSIHGETPTARKQRLTELRQQQAVSAIETDPKVNKLLDHFDGALDRESIKPIENRVN